LKLIFASNNVHKLEELRSAIGSGLRILSLEDAGIQKKIPEPFDSLKKNAQEKAETISRLTGGENCFSEDTGLEVVSLGGAPGVHSARYAGEPVSSENNIRKLLLALNGFTHRSAAFTTVICLIWEGELSFFEGRCEGRILNYPQGNFGFGYDPVFMPDGSSRSFAEMNTEEKNIFSHRRKAADQLIAFLKTKTGTPAHAKNKN